MEDNRPTRRWFQFSLRTLLVLIALVGCGCAWISMQLQQKRRHDSAVTEIVKLGGLIYFDDDREVPGWIEEVPVWKEWLFGSYAVKHVAVNLDGADATDALLYQIEGMNLTYLRLHSTKVADAGLIHLKRLNNLQTLSLSRTRVTDAGLTHLKKLTSLKHLDLSHAPITGSGLIHLRGLTNLGIIDLGHTQITDSGLEQLKGLTSLKHISLQSTQVTQAGIDKLRQAMPGCTIHP